MTIKKSLWLTSSILLLNAVVVGILLNHFSGAAHLSESSAYILWLITETGSMPYALITTLVLALGLWFIGGHHYRYRFIAVLSLSMLLTQITMQGIKVWVGEPRPFVNAIYAGNQADIAAFYAKTKEQRAVLVQHAYRNAAVPDFLKNHRAKETGYSFPSGHTIFAASWALLYAAFARGKRRKTATTAVISWAVVVMNSRVWLDMHYPQDLIASVCLAALINLLLLWFFCRESLITLPADIQKH